MANPIVIPSGDSFVLAMGVPTLGPSQTLVSGQMQIGYSGAGLPLSSPLLMADQPALFIPGTAPVVFNATRMFLMFG